MKFTDINDEKEFVVADNYDQSGLQPIYVEIEGMAMGLTRRQAEDIVGEIIAILSLEKYKEKF